MAMASIPPSYYHASAAIPIANHSDFFNTHARFHLLTAGGRFRSSEIELGSFVSVDFPTLGAG